MNEETNNQQLSEDEKIFLRRELISRESNKIQIGIQAISISETQSVTIETQSVTSGQGLEVILNPPVLKEYVETILKEIENDWYMQTLHAYFKALQFLNKSAYKSLNFKEMQLDNIYIQPTFIHTVGVEVTEHSISNIISNYNRNSHPILILGDPGSGKSSFLRFLAINAWNNPESLGLSDKYIPILVRLQSLGKAKQIDIGKRLLAALNDAMDITTTIEPPADFLFVGLGY